MQVFNDSVVVVKGHRHKVLSCQKGEDEFFYYYVQDVESKEVYKICEKTLLQPLIMDM